MHKARIHRRVGLLATVRIDHGYPLRRRGGASGALAAPDHVFCGKQRAFRRGRGGAGEDELVRRKARALICLEHPVREAERSRDIEIRLHRPGCVVHEFELRVRGRHARRGDRLHLDAVGAGHRPAGVHLDPIPVAMPEVIATSQRDARQRDRLAGGVDAAGGDIDAGLERGIAAKEIVDRAVFLHDNHDMGKLHRLRHGARHSRQHERCGPCGQNQRSGDHHPGHVSTPAADASGIRSMSKPKQCALQSSTFHLVSQRRSSFGWHKACQRDESFPVWTVPFDPRNRLEREDATGCDVWRNTPLAQYPRIARANAASSGAGVGGALTGRSFKVQLFSPAGDQNG